jgi:hypothetical protein
MMHTDKLTKTILATIAIALWVIAMNPWLHPMPASAQEKIDLSQVESTLSDIQSDLHHIALGVCINSKIC